MSEHLDRARSYREAIRRVLLHEWDPIGVADIPKAQYEYDSYVGQVYALLIRQVPEHKLIDFLWWAETVHMGLCGRRRHMEKVARRLLQLPNELGGQSADEPSSQPNTK